MGWHIAIEVERQQLHSKYSILRLLDRRIQARAQRQPDNSSRPDRIENSVIPQARRRMPHSQKARPAATRTRAETEGWRDHTFRLSIPLSRYLSFLPSTQPRAIRITPVAP